VLSCDVIIWDDNTPLFCFSWKLHSLTYNIKENEPMPPPCVRPGCRVPSKPKQRAKREEDLREKERKGRLGQTQEVGGSCAAFNPLGTRGAGKVQLNRQSSQ
jgi:hypothetical protein